MIDLVEMLSERECLMGTEPVLILNCVGGERPHGRLAIWQACVAMIVNV